MSPAHCLTDLIVSHLGTLMLPISSSVVFSVVTWAPPPTRPRVGRDVAIPPTRRSPFQAPALAGPRTGDVLLLEASERVASWAASRAPRSVEVRNADRTGGGRFEVGGHYDYSDKKVY